MNTFTRQLALAALFSLLGTTFGGDGVINFALPDLRGRLANGLGQGTGLANYSLGQRGGEEAHTLTATETPSHNHLVNAVKNGTTGGTSTPGGGVTLGEGYASETGSPAVNVYSSAAPTIAIIVHILVRLFAWGAPSCPVPRVLV